MTIRSQIVKITTIATMWYSIYWMRTLTKKHNYIAISIAAATTVNYILRNLKMGYCVFSLHNKSYLIRDDVANSLTAHRTSSIQ